MLLSYSLFIIYGKPMQRKKKKDQVHINYVHWDIWYAAYHQKVKYLSKFILAIIRIGAIGIWIIRSFWPFSYLNSEKARAKETTERIDTTLETLTSLESRLGRVKSTNDDLEKLLYASQEDNRLLHANLSRLITDLKMTKQSNKWFLYLFVTFCLSIHFSCPEIIIIKKWL